MKIPKIEFDIYTKLNGDKLEKLSLNSCKNNKISLLIPVKDIDNIDKLNSSSRYYTDVCYTAISDSGTDISLKDRKNEYPSKTVCQDGCDFVGYDSNTKKAKCSCEPKESSSSFADMEIDKKKLLNNFKNIKNIANFKILKCAKVLFSKISISKNVGFYILIANILFHSIVLILFYKKKLDFLKNKINEIILAINYKKLIKEDEKNKEIIKIEPTEKEKENNKIKLKLADNNIINKYININKEVNKFDKVKQQKKKGKIITKSKKIKIPKNVVRIYSNNNNSIKSDLNSDNILINIKNEEKNYLPEDSKKIEKIKKLESIMDYNDDEINDFSYYLALENDKRTYWQLYISLIKTKHEFIYTFFYNKDYNSKIIKIDLFISGLCSKLIIL